MNDRIRAGRERERLTQHELAERAGLTRQLVSAVESGRNVPSVAAAIALARALGATVEELFDDHPPGARVTGMVDISGARPQPGTSIRAARVGERIVAVPVSHETGGFERWASADAVAGERGPTWLPGAAVDGLLLAGCDPVLGLIEALVADRSPHRVVTAHASSGQAVAALAAGRVHGVVVHGEAGSLPVPPVEVERWGLASWQVGLAAGAADTPPTVEELVERRSLVVQRDAGAGSQHAFERALAAAGATDGLPGPVADGHLDAALRIVHGGARAAVTMEAAAAAFDLVFSPLEVHEVELWIDARWSSLPAVRAVLELVTGSDFRRHVGRLAGYDLSRCGQRLAG